MKNVAFLLVFAVLFVMGCSDEDPAAPHVDEFHVELTMNPDHVHTLAETEFEVVIEDHAGSHVTDFEQVTVEHMREGTSDWRSIELTLHEDHYTGSYTFTSSGDYEMRVMGMAHEGHDLEQIHHVEGGLHVGRAHVTQGAYRIEYESYPGHIHEGDTVTLTFWVLDGTDRTPITGLTADGACEESGSTNHTFSLPETAAGEYAADHTVENAGPTTMVITFDDPLGTGMIEAEFDIEVAHGH